MAGKSLHELYMRFVSDAYEDDMSAQRYYLSMIEEERKIPVEYLISRGMTFVPNNDYIRHYLGNDANTYGAELYIEDRCMWALYALIPVMDLSEDVVGLVGWDAQHKYQELVEGATGLPMYRVSSKNVFARERYFLADVPLLKQCFDQRVLFIVDGVFDSVSLNYRGLPAISLLGSTFSREVLYFLRWYKSIYVLCDNDAAGNSLLSKLRKSLPAVYRVSQNKEKDIEKLLRSDGADGPITQQLKEIIDMRPAWDVTLKV